MDGCLIWNLNPLPGGEFERILQHKRLPYMTLLPLRLYLETHHYQSPSMIHLSYED